MIFMRFTPFYAPLWDTTTEHVWPVIRSSGSGASFWLEFKGHDRCVPTCCVELAYATPAPLDRTQEVTV